jgi:hypothetical protein
MDKDTKNGITGAVTATVLAPHATRRLLGYHVVRHGTSNENAAKVKKEGFDPKKGGSGAGTHAAGSAERAAKFQAESRGKVHVTKNPIIARAFAGMTNDRTHKPSIKTMATRGTVLKARVSHQHWESMKEDKHIKGMKFDAATTHHKIPASQVIGGEGNTGIRGVVNKNTLRKYYKNSANRGRIARGAMMAVGAASGLVDAAKAIHKRKHND